MLDYKTGEPIPGAIVVARWLATIVGSGQGTCVQVETAVSDGKGKYRIASWQRTPPALILGAGLELDVYRPGYESVHAPVVYAGLEPNKWIVYRRDPPNEILHTFPDEASAKAATHPEDVYLKVFTGSASARFEYLRGRVVSGMSCHGAGTSERNRYPLVRAAFQEAKPLAVTKEQQKSLGLLRDIALSTWLALPNFDTPTPKNPVYPEQVLKDLE